MQPVSCIFLLQTMIKFICAYVGERTFELRNRAKVLFYKIVVNADFINLYEMQTGVTVSFTDVTKLVDMLATSYPKNGVSKIGLLRSIAKVAGLETVKHISNGVYTVRNQYISFGGDFLKLIEVLERTITRNKIINEKLGAFAGKITNMERALISFLQQDVKEQALISRVTSLQLLDMKNYLRKNAFVANIARSKKFAALAYECETTKLVASIDLSHARADSYPHTGTPLIIANLIMFAKDTNDYLFEINAKFAYSDAMSNYIGWLDDFVKMLALQPNCTTIEPNEVLVQIIQFIAECKHVQ